MCFAVQCKQVMTELLVFSKTPGMFGYSFRWTTYPDPQNPHEGNCLTHVFRPRHVAHLPHLCLDVRPKFVTETSLASSLKRPHRLGSRPTCECVQFVLTLFPHRCFPASKPSLVSTTISRASLPVLERSRASRTCLPALELDYHLFATLENWLLGSGLCPVGFLTPNMPTSA